MHVPLPNLCPGDLIEVVGAEYPPKSGKVKPWLGLYGDPGYPSIELLSVTRCPPPHELFTILNKNIVGNVKNGSNALIVAITLDKDGRWYYMLNTATCKLGWTRCSIRMKKLNT